MINLAIVGLYNRGQQDEYVEMEAASSCSLSRFTLIRRVENEEVVFGLSRYLAKYLDMLAVLSLDTLPFMFTYFSYFSEKRYFIGNRRYTSRTK